MQFHLFALKKKKIIKTSYYEVAVLVKLWGSVSSLTGAAEPEPVSLFLQNFG